MLTVADVCRFLDDFAPPRLAEEWDNVIAVNLSGTFYCCQAAARRMREGGGRSAWVIW